MACSRTLASCCSTDEALHQAARLDQPSHSHRQVQQAPQLVLGKLETVRLGRDTFACNAGESPAQWCGLRLLGFRVSGAWCWHPYSPWQGTRYTS